MPLRQPDFVELDAQVRFQRNALAGRDGNRHGDVWILKCRGAGQYRIIDGRILAPATIGLYARCMDAEEELRKTIEGVQAREAKRRADADQKGRAAQSEATSAEAAMVEQFVRIILPSVVQENMPKVSRIAGRPVNTAAGSPANAFHGDHHDWYYAFEVGRAEAVVESHLRQLEIRVNGKPYRINAVPDRDAAIKLYNTVVERGLSG